MSDEPFATDMFSMDCPRCGPGTVQFLDGEMVPHGCDYEPPSLTIRCAAPTPAEVVRAIAIIEHSRSTHVDWAEWQEATLDWQDHIEPTDPGDPEHHRRCIAEYDEVLAVLRAVQPRGQEQP